MQELLILLAAKGRIVPPALLPELLTWGQRSKQRRILIAPVAGERGRWLTLHNPEWKNALQVDPKDAAEQAEAARNFSNQQALYDALEITDNIFSRGYSIFKGQGLSGHGRMIQLVMDKIVALSKPGAPYVAEQKIINIAGATPPAILSELVGRIRQILISGEKTWRSRLVELMEFRQQMLEELNHE